MRKIDILSHEDAFKIVDAIRIKANEESRSLAVAIVDRHGELLAFLRTDGCRLSSIQIAMNKAYTAAREHIPSGELGARSKSEGFPMTNFGELRYVTWGGGVPITYESSVVGAVGVSGMDEATDIAFAELGIAAITLTA